MIKATSYEQEYLTNIPISTIYKSQEIFIPEPYNIIIVMGGDYFHKLNQLNVIRKTTKPNETDAIIFHAKNIKPIDFPIPLAQKCTKYAKIYKNQKELIKFLNDEILIFLSKNMHDQTINTIKVTIYEQKYMYDSTTYCEGDTRKIFIHSPYNILIIMGGDDFHELNQISVIRKADKPKYNKNDKITTIFGVKNIRETFMPIELVRTFAEFVSNNQDEIKKSLNVDILNIISS